jgi:iron complex outermembrane receptor protein
MARRPPRRSVRARRARLVAVAALAAAAPLAAQTPPPPAAAGDVPVATLAPIVVTATRSAERAFDVPASVDVIDARTLHEGQPQVNLSETLARVPGLFAMNRQNYAQDLQISSRGFGSRAQFGVRGVRLYQDGIPVTMPDGQGQTGSFSLLSAQRVEVVRGPFSTLYGNASGGVIAVFTEDPRAPGDVTLDAGGGSYGTWTAGAKLNTRAGDAGAVVAATHFATDGWRDHSAARREITNAKLVFMPSEDTRITVIGNTQYQPETQDPLGLTRDQWAANRRGVDPSALAFDTRKTIDQVQGGASVVQRLGAAFTLDLDGYGGRRKVRQYLSFSGAALTSSGGVVDLDRDYGGVGARLTWRGAVLDRPLQVVVGADADRQQEHRQGFVNNNGALGDLRRDEDDTVSGSDAYVEAKLSLLPQWTLTAGVRTSRVNYESADHFITPSNPDDSGERTFRDTSPVLGVVWHAREDVNVYASYGEGFETPTFAELAYRSGGTGLNFGLQPATSRAFEVGAKYLTAHHRVTLAGFVTRTRNEIVIDAATGGRTTFKNASRTRRHGIEALWDGELGRDFTAHADYTWLVAEFDDAFSTGAPPTVVPAGARLPGVPSQQAYAELAWRPRAAPGWVAAVEAQYVDKVYVNERNSDAAPSYAVANARVGYELRRGNATLRTFARLNNLFDRNYAGSVIVGDTNGRYFEPAPGRNWFAGVDLLLAL